MADACAPSYERGGVAQKVASKSYIDMILHGLMADDLAARHHRRDILGGRAGGTMVRPCALIVVLSLATASIAHADPPSPIADRDVVRAHQKKVVGAALIGVGSGLALVGQILFIHAALNPLSTHSACAMGYPDCNHEYLNPLEVIPGGVFVGVGGALLLTGIPLYVVGGAQMRHAERSRPTLTFAPQLGPQGASLSARIRF
jgi:hypothetical protein